MNYNQQVMGIQPSKSVATLPRIQAMQEELKNYVSPLQRN